MASSSASQSTPALVHIMPLLLPFLVLSIMVTIEASPHGYVSLRSQAAALLQWRPTMKGNAASVLNSWRPDIHPCNWTGITCADDKIHHATRALSITKISLQGAGVEGQLDTLDLFSLPDITSLDLSNNNDLSDQIPPSIGSLKMLDNLNLSGCHLEGSIPSAIGNLKMIKGMCLDNNLLSGPIPDELGKLSLLSHLDISSNNLTLVIPPSIGNLTSLSYLVLSNNMLTGPIPKEIGNLKRLVCLDVAHNLLTGFIPSTIVSLTGLQTLILEVNNMGGTILDKVEHLYNLEVLSIEYNEFVGSIPSGLKNLSSLGKLNLGYNNFTGVIPSTMGDMSSLIFLSLASNMLSGTIPLELGNLTNLDSIWIYKTRISGSVPESFGNLKNMTDLRLFANDLSGPVPSVLSNLINLVIADFSNNSFTGKLPDLCQGKMLRHLNFWLNMFHGSIADSYRYCTSLEFLSFSHKKLEGNLSEHFGIYPHLTILDLSQNNFYGPLSPNWGSCHKLTTMWMFENMISGIIPMEFSKLRNLRELLLYSNSLSGEIPPEIGDMENLYRMDLCNNKLFGRVPSEIGHLTNLEKLHLCNNQLSGTVPKELVNCQKLSSFKLNGNNISGNLSGVIGSMMNLHGVLDLSKNNLNGTIPQELGNLNMLECLNLSHNQFKGGIPSSVRGMQSLSVFDVLFNDMEGPVPEGIHNFSINWFLHNKGLCGNYFGLQPCYSPPVHKNGEKHIKLVLVIGCLLLLCVLLIMIVLFIRPMKKLEDTTIVGVRDVFSIWNFDGRLAFEDIISATENFDEKYCIGARGNGIVYKAQLQTGTVYAIKKLHSTEEVVDNARFHREIDVLMKIRHRNIVKLYGYCLHGRFRFLVYDFVERGSLAAILCDEELATEFHWQKRISLIKDVARAIYYLHHDCDPPVIHRDITSRNILLDANYKASLSDFGTAKIIKPESLNWTELAGTYGYMAPELSYKPVPMEKCDVYSFGVVIMEVVMGNHPGDLICHLASLDEELDVLLGDIIDKRPAKPTCYEDIVQLITIAKRCVQASPEDRPTTQQVYQILPGGY